MKNALLAVILMVGVNAEAQCPFVSFIKHPALVTRTWKGLKIAGKDIVVAAKDVAGYSKKVLF